MHASYNLCADQVFVRCCGATFEQGVVRNMGKKEKARAAQDPVPVLRGRQTLMLS